MKGVTGMFDNARLKRREALIKDLKERISELESQRMNEKELDEERIKVKSLIYQLTQLLDKMTRELKELEEAKKNYETERFKFVRLNASYRKKMERFMNEVNIKKEDDA